jgi:hypothetical protein
MLTDEELKSLEEDIELPSLKKTSSSVKEENHRLKKSEGKDFIKGIKESAFNSDSKKIDDSTPKSYIKSVPLMQANKNGEHRVDPMKTIYFRLGHNPVYTESFYVFMPKTDEKMVSIGMTLRIARRSLLTRGSISPKGLGSDVLLRFR